MKLRYRILSVIGVLLVLGVGSLAVALSYNGSCGTSAELPANALRMKAIVQRCYGSPEVLRLEEVAKPTPQDNQLLVKVRAAAANPLDWHYMRGEPYIMRMEAGFGRPKEGAFGVDFAGTVEAVGKDVRRFKVGDEVFGGRSGAFAEYVTVREDRAVALKPTNITAEQAAAVPIAAVTALQGLRDHGKVQAGQKVLINGASGGVGTFAVQIAKTFGAEVTGVCSTPNVELVRSLGADHVIDYKQEDFTQGEQRYDVILDNVGNHPLSELTRVLQPNGILVIVGGLSDDPWFGAMKQPIKAKFLSPFVSQKLVMFLARLDQADLEFLSGLMQAGKVTPVIDRRYALNEVPEAIRYLEEGRARGKVIVTVESL
jgi:NADPH:quinone reductase-like Zn-dependent oxidoreductase